MAFALFTTVFVIFFLLCIGVAFAAFFDEPFLSLILVVLAVATVIVWFQFNQNRDTYRNDEGRIVAITQLIDRPTQYSVTQPDGYQATQVTCAYPKEDQCSALKLGDTVTVRTTYNTVGWVDLRTIIISS
jgi:hypothetical protein